MPPTFRFFSTPSRERRDGPLQQQRRSAPQGLPDHEQGPSGCLCPRTDGLPSLVPAPLPPFAVRYKFPVHMPLCGKPVPFQLAQTYAMGTARRQPGSRGERAMIVTAKSEASDIEAALRLSARVLRAYRWRCACTCSIDTVSSNLAASARTPWGRRCRPPLRSRLKSRPD